MFTGIIQQQGKITKVGKNGPITVITIEAPQIAPAKKLGDSIAVDGACLTVVARIKDSFTVEVIPETMDKTIIGNYREGTEVNLENPLKYGDSLDGHAVQGHVDFVGKVEKVTSSGSKTMEVTYPEEMNKYFALKGSVTVNGVSLTISKLGPKSFEVSLIPTTMKTTNLNALKKGSVVNVEVDLLARYMERLLLNKAEQTTYDFLQERGSM